MGSIFLVMYYVTISICLTRISVKRFFIKGHNTTDNIKKRRFIRTAFQKNHQKKERRTSLFRQKTYLFPSCKTTSTAGQKEEYLSVGEQTLIWFFTAGLL